MNKPDANIETKDINLRDFSNNGKIGFRITADDTVENQQTHDAFKGFCKVETDNNYTQGLRKLLEYYQGDFKIEMLHNVQQEQAVTLADLKGSIVELAKKRKAPVDEEDTGAF